MTRRIFYRHRWMEWLPEDHPAAIAGARAEIKARAAERHARKQAGYEDKVTLRWERERQTGKKAWGKKPKPSEVAPKDSDQVNLTDEKSCIMPVSGGGFEQAYNAQASVDMNTMLECFMGNRVYRRLTRMML